MVFMATAASSRRKLTDTIMVLELGVDVEPAQVIPKQCIIVTPGVLTRGARVPRWMGGVEFRELPVFCLQSVR